MSLDMPALESNYNSYIWYLEMSYRSGSPMGLITLANPYKSV